MKWDAIRANNERRIMDERQEQLDAEDRQIESQQRQEQAARMQPPEPATVEDCDSQSVSSEKIFGETTRKI